MTLLDTIARDGEARGHVLSVLRRLTPDRSWTERIVAHLETGATDFRCALAHLARRRAPRVYVEVGVRRGMSLAVVASLCPDAALYGFDQWIGQYAGSDNPGPDFVRDEIGRFGCVPILVSGDSRVTLPAFFADAPGFTFDLALVDGDHTEEGAEADLHAVLPHCAPGGAVVFDDLNAPELLAVWRKVGASTPGFTFHEWLADVPSFGVAVRAT